MKKTPVRPSPSSASFTDVALPPSHKEIATRAEALWRDKGSPQGCDDELWLEAERQLCHRPGPEGEGEGIALADLHVDFDQKSDDLMDGVNELFPEQTGKETTSL
jgi:hypothetical protein